MKAYRQDLLEVAFTDRELLELPADPLLAGLLAPFHAEAAEMLLWIATMARGLAGEEDAAFDLLYRRSHRLAGLAGLLRLPKLAHVLELLAFVLDLGRELQTLERHSLGYLVALLTTGARDILADLGEPHGTSSRNVGDTVDECRTYLAGPFAQTHASRLQAPWQPTGGNPAGAMPLPKPQAALPSLIRQETAADGPEDDGPEELHIPNDKVGLTSDFCEEAHDSLAAVGRHLVELESSVDPILIVNDLFRAVHTVKGGARLLRVGKVERLAHAMEALLDEVRTGARPVGAKLIDVLLDGHRLLDDMVDEVALRGPIRTRIGPVLVSIAALGGGTSLPAALSLPAPATPLTPASATTRPVRPASGQQETIRVTTDKLDDVLNTASEVFIGRIRLKSDVDALAVAVHHFGHALQQSNPFDGRKLLDRMADSNRRLLADLQGLLARNRGPVSPKVLATLVNRFLSELAAEAGQHDMSGPEELTLNLLSIEDIRKRLDKNVEQLEQLSGRLQSGTMRFRMVPIAHLFDRFPTQMRELARQLGKKVQIEVGGVDTELDKVMASRLADPLLHILRNSLDHGLEEPALRLAAGKPEAGRITLRAFYQGSNAVIEVRDDGRGIDPGRVLAKAVQAGLVEADRAPTLSRNEVLQLIFAPGLSTATSVSTVSGRGVGMDVVMTAISQVQGSVHVDSVQGQGTTISIRLPLTLAVIGILLVQEGAHLFALPIQHVEEILNVRTAELRQLGGTTLYTHRGAALPVMSVSSVLQFPPSAFAEGEVAMVVLVEGERRVGILLDAVLGRQEVLIRNLGRLIRKAPFVIGCTILSDSRLVLILNAWELVHSQDRKSVAAILPSLHQGVRQGERKKHTVLVVDDSPIQRNHLGAMLTQAGYRVEAAENGFAAVQRLRTRRYSAFCVDVIMPLMDGFEFTERLRRLPEQKNSPVFLVTGQSARALAAEQDRASQLGVAGMFRKPVDAVGLLDALDAACLPADMIAAEDGTGSGAGGAALVKV